MGCGSSGASSQASKGNDVIKEDVVQPFDSTDWATKKQQAGHATSSDVTSKDKDPSSPYSGGSGGGPKTAFASSAPAAGAAGKGPKNQTATEQLVMNDIDVESDCEVIFEGKMSPQHQNHGQNPQDANAQEAPNSAEPDVGKNSAADEQKPIVLSKQQQEEAAKMAEQRKRFDNQKYQSQTTGSGGVEGHNSPPAGSVVTKLPLGGHQEGIVPTLAAHEAVMGVNASTSPRKVPLGMETECLPGGVMDDTPRDEVYILKSRNNHQVFDDDEEMLMKDIMDEVEGGR